MIQEGIRLATEGTDLSEDMAREIMDEMMSGRATHSQMASFLTAMRMKGETRDELLGLVKGMRSKAVRVSAPERAIDLCGTGGDGTRTFNISTAASFVAAACGAHVAKHGNRAISSRAGSADVLSAMGIPVALDSAAVERCLHETGIGFMFAPAYHESMRNVMVTRREIGIRTFFNILGPLANPALVKRQLIGVYDPRLARTVADVLSALGTEHSMVVHGSGMDEISGSGPTRVVETKDGTVREYEISPADFGASPSGPEDIAGGSAQQNARIMLSVLGGEDSPRSDIVAMNAGAALLVAGEASSLKDGFSLSKKAMADGRALRKLESFSDLCSVIESEAQKDIEVSRLRNRRIMPDILRTRCVDLSSDLAMQISRMDDGGTMLDLLDADMLDSPSVLSVLALTRLTRVQSLPNETTSEALNRSSARFSDSLRGVRGLAVIAEYKPRSPSTKGLHAPPDPTMAARVYTEGGVASMSVLAEEDFFGGGDELFASIRKETSLPMLYKDFVVSERQIRRARSLGADAVLLIAKVLGKDTLEKFVDATIGLGMEPLVEIHDLVDLEKVQSCPNTELIELIGVNGRDLRTLDVDVERTNELRTRVGDGKTVIAESGMQVPGDVRTLRGFDAVLIGSMFMRAVDLETIVRDTVAAASEVVR